MQFSDIAAAIGFIADLFGVLLGGVALYALIFHRKKISLFLRIVLNSHFNERVKRMKETLGKLEQLSFDEKEHKSEIRNLLGQLNGQIKPMASDKNGLIRLQVEISAILKGEEKLTEPMKRQIIYDVHGVLDNANLSDITSIMENSNDGR